VNDSASLDVSSRDTVAKQLADMSASGGPLDTSSPLNTTIRYAAFMQRLTFRRAVIDRYLEDVDTPPREGRSAVITAGPPGAGKSTLLTQQIADMQGYRRLDADTVKNYLIRQALDDHIYDDLLDHTLTDGHPLAPGELAALVHHESTMLIDTIRELCLSRRENILIEGTLSWPGHGLRIMGELSAAEYTRIQIIGVEVPASVAHEQALDRWWSARQAWICGEDEFGGRYTPPAAIDSCYGGDKYSKCARNALAAFRSVGDKIPDVSLTMYSGSGDGQFDEILKLAAP
jgi:hypothetical protein